MNFKPNWVEINLDALTHNLSYIKSITNTKILLPVKADAYGHGSLACSFAAQKAGVDYLGVAHSFEAVALRKYGISIPILILGPVHANDFKDLIKYDITPSFPQENEFWDFQDFLASKNISHKVHIKVNTGMNRYGFPWKDHDTLESLYRAKNCIVEGVFSHLACSENTENSQNNIQISRFLNLKEQLSFSSSVLFHLANSGGVLNYPESYLDLVRPGIMCYGYSPNQKPNPNLQSTMRVYARVRQIQKINKGEGVSYGLKWIAQAQQSIAAVSIGYGDGLPRSCTGYFCGNDEKYQMIGTICMDTTMISNVNATLKDSDVLQIAGFPENNLSIEEVSNKAKQISYEFTCGIARRMHRSYIFNGSTLSWDELKPLLGVGHV
jgi:alanine racemase